MDTYMYKCPNCGSGMEYDAQTHIFHCDYCRSDFTAEELEERRIKAEQRQAEKEEASMDDSPDVYSCPSCGAEIITDETTAATYCYYCHNPVVLSGKLSGEFKPDYIIPFKFDRQDAEKRFHRWIKNKRFLPNDFKNDSVLENLYGVYYPYWMTNCTVKGGYSATGRNIRVWITGELEYTETKVYEIKREGSIEFNNINSFAMTGERAKPAMAVQPFSDEGLEEFKMAYLSGFYAEKRNLEYAEIEDEVNGRVNEYAKKIFENSVTESYQSIGGKTMHADVVNSRQKYVLLPVWILTYNLRGKKYYFAMNGQTGKTVGRLPISIPRIVGAVLGIFLLLFLIVMGIGAIIL